MSGFVTALYASYTGKGAPRSAYNTACRKYVTHAFKEVNHFTRGTHGVTLRTG